MKIKQIKEFVDSKVGIDISTKLRKREFVDARFYYVKLCYKYSTEYLSLAKVGYIINRDHASVLHAQSKFNELYDSDKDFTDKFDKLEHEFLMYSDTPNPVINENEDLIQVCLELKKENELLKRNFHNSLEKNKELYEEIHYLRDRFYQTLAND